jgi:hypothetical protein
MLKHLCFCGGDPYCDLVVGASAAKNPPPVNSARGKLANLTNKARPPKLAERSKLKLKSRLNTAAVVCSDYLESVNTPTSQLSRSFRNRLITHEYDSISNIAACVTTSDPLSTPSFTASSSLTATATNSIHFYHPKSIEKQQLPQLPPQPMSLMVSTTTDDSTLVAESTNDKAAASAIYSKMNTAHLSLAENKVNRQNNFAKVTASKPKVAIRSPKKKLVNSSYKPNVYESIPYAKSSTGFINQPSFKQLQFKAKENVSESGGYFELSKWAANNDEAIANVIETGSLSGQEIAYVAQSELDSTGSASQQATKINEKLSDYVSLTETEYLSINHRVEDDKACCQRCGRFKKKATSRLRSHPGDSSSTTMNQSVYYDFFKSEDKFTTAHSKGSF